jgi:hypothetical protein
MKTRNVITAIGAAALAAITLSLNAGEPLRSPRALDNEIKIVPGRFIMESCHGEPQSLWLAAGARQSGNHVQGTGTS